MSTRPPHATGQAARRDVAIIGMACTYPGARTPARFWQNIVRKVDAVTEVPADRWPLELAGDPAFASADGVTTRKGGWLDSSFAFNPLQYGIMPSALEGAEPDHFLVLRTAYEALDDAGYVSRDLDGCRVSVILGKGNYLGPGTTGLVYRGSVSEQALALVRSLYPDWKPEDIHRLRDVLRRNLPKLSPEAAGGLIPNICTGRVANRLNFTGRNFTVDGACASSLIATELGVQGLTNGVEDLVLVGGVHVVTHLGFLQVFDAMHALSQGATIRPFDERCDGTLVGEGIGMLVLKRLDDAERDGDRIYAVIKGVGTSSDGRAKSVTAPRVEGEHLALRRAYDASGVAPQTIGLIEGHGTGTLVGDAAEIDALKHVFGPNEHGWPTCAVGSIKSMIGHTMPAAGAAGMIKAALSLYHRVLPPTLHCESPRPALSAGESPFYVNGEARPWVHPSKGTPRRAGVSAFGFGGVNAHVVLEEYTGAAEVERPTLLQEWDNELVVVEAASREGLVAEVQRLREYVGQVEGVTLRDIAWTLNSALDSLPPSGLVPRRPRVAIVATSLEDLGRKLATVATRLSDPGCAQIKDQQGIFFFGGDAVAGHKVALLFPGEGSQYPNMLAEVCLHFPQAREVFDLADNVRRDRHRPPPSTFIFPLPPAATGSASAGPDAAADHLWTIDRATEAVLTADIAVYRLLSALGLQPDMMAGHSGGEWIALAAAGVLDMTELVGTMNRLSAMYRQVSDDGDIPKMAMLAVGAGRERIERLLTALGRRAHVANDNCAHQVIIAVEPADEAAILDGIRQHGIFVEKLPYDRGYHTPAFTHMSASLLEYFSSLTIRPARVPLYSGATTRLYPTDRDQVLELASTTYARPLLFRQTIEAMYEAGARIFVEAGPRGNLSAFVDDILRGRPHVTVPIDQFRRPGLTTLNFALGLLAAAGVRLDFRALYARRMPRQLTLDARQDRRPDEDHVPGTIRLSTCYPTLTLPSEADGLTVPTADSLSVPAPVSSAAMTSSAVVPTSAAAPAAVEGALAMPPLVTLPAEPPAAANGVASEAVVNGATAAIHLAHRGHDEAVMNDAYVDARHGDEDEDLVAWEADDVLSDGAAGQGAAFGEAVSGGGAWLEASGDLDRVLQDHVALMGEFLDLHETVLTRSLRTLTHTHHAPHPPSLAARASRGTATGAVSPSFHALEPSVPSPTRQSPTLPPPARPPSEAPPAVVPAPASARAPASAPVAPDESHVEGPLDVVVSDAAPSHSASVDPAGLLLQIVSDRTGYPADMLGLDLDLEADLGIDSIKKVEIFATLGEASREAGIEAHIEMEEIATFKTLRQIAARLTDGSGPAPGSASAGPAPANAGAAQEKARPEPAKTNGHAHGSDLLHRQPLIRASTVVEHAAGVTLTLRCRIDREEHRYLDDHALNFETPGRRDPDSRLLSMPLTGTLEMMAEAAAVLCPGLRVVGATGLRAPQALHVETSVGHADLLITASVLDAGRVKVTVRQDAAAATASAPAAAPASAAVPAAPAPVPAAAQASSDLLAEATLIVAKAFPSEPPREPLALENPRDPECRTGSDIYGRHHLFHGPRFQGIRDVAAVADNGLTGRLSVLPYDDVLRSDRQPAFHFDPFLLDAAGQMVGYWPVEYLEIGFIVLPIQIDTIAVYGETPAPGSAVTCELSVRDVTHRDLRVDIDLIAPDGGLFIRITGWRDWRFYWSRELYDFWRFQDHESIGRRIEAPALAPRQVECRFVQPLSEPDRTGLWAEIWARMILSGRERAALAAPAPAPAAPGISPDATPPPVPPPSSSGQPSADAAVARLRRLVQQAAAKDAVRSWLQAHVGRDVHPADLDVTLDDADGRARAGRWSGLSSGDLHVAVYGDDRMAVAAAGPRPIAITSGEDETACAKQAAILLLGQGAPGQPHAPVRTGVRANGEITFSAGGRAIAVSTLRDAQTVIAVACLEPAATPEGPSA